MNYVVFDSETTGFGQNDEVVQFSALLLDANLRLLKVYNCYSYTQVPFNTEASKVNGLTAEKVHALSNGMFFEDFYYGSDLFKLQDVVWCGWNVTFDIRMVNNTLRNNGLDQHDFGKETKRFDKRNGTYFFDVMKMNSVKKGISHNEKLEKCVKELKYSEEKLNAMYGKLLRIAGISSDLTYHNSLYDSMVTWLYLAANRKWCY